MLAMALATIPDSDSHTGICIRPMDLFSELDIFEGAYSSIVSFQRYKLTVSPCPVAVQSGLERQTCTLDNSKNPRWQLEMTRPR